MKNYCSLLVIFGVVGHLASVGGNVINKVFYTSCEDPNGMFPGLLSFAKKETTRNVTWNCTGVDMGSFTRTLDWYYYVDETYRNSNCTHSIKNSTMHYTNSTIVDNGGTVVGTSVGTVTAGEFVGQPTTLVNIRSGNVAGCNSPQGEEASSGTNVLTIGSALTGGILTCRGIMTSEYCPGLHSA